MVKNVKQWLKTQGRVTLAAFLRTYRNVPHTSTGRTPAEIIFGRIPHTHLSMVVQWNLIVTVTLGPNLAGWYIEVAFLLSGIQNHHN